MDKIYSTDKEDWTFSNENINKATEDHLSDLSQKEIGGRDFLVVYEGVKKPFAFNDFLDVDTIIEDMQIGAYDNVSEHSNDYLSDVTDEQKEELRLLICEWAKRHELAPDFFIVDNVEEIKVKITDEMRELK